MTQSIDLDSDWSSESFEALLAAASLIGGYCFLVRREFCGPGCDTWLEAARPWLVETLTTQEWPGTQLFDSETALLHRFRIELPFLDLIRAHAASPFDFIAPDLPEDLCFTDDQGKVWFTSIAHEQDAWLSLGERYKALIAQAVPLLFKPSQKS